MFFDPNQKENIAEQLRCYSSINVGVNTVVPYSTAFDWLNPNLRIYKNFNQFRKNEFTFPAPSKKIRIPPAFQPIKKEPSPEINLNHVPKQKCDWKYEAVTFVKTRPGNFEHRELMRQMVAKTKENWKIKESESKIFLSIWNRDERTRNTCSRTVLFYSVLQSTEQNTKMILGLEHRTEHGIFSGLELEQNMKQISILEHRTEHKRNFTVLSSLV